MSKIKASAEIIRPANALMGGIGVIVGALASGFFTNPLVFPLILGFAIVFCISSAGMIINDVVDIEIDRINCPERVLPSGRLSLHEAKILFGVYVGAGVILAVLTLNLAVVLITIGGTALTVAYSTTLKRYGFVGNLVVALLTSMALLLGGAIQGQLGIAAWPALVAFLINMGREITKGIDDLLGDMDSNVKTLAVVLGPKKAAWVAVAFMIATIAVAVVPYVLLLFSVLFFVVLILIAFIIGYVCISLLRSATPENAHRLKTIQKIAMFLGLLAFLLGAIPF